MNRPARILSSDFTSKRAARKPARAKRHGRIVSGDFVPHPLLRGPHLQTLATLFRPAPRLELKIERHELPDGDFVDLGWCGPSRARPGAPLAVLLHGLSGGFDSKYARGLAQQMLARGWRAVILQLRGAGPEPNRLPRTYHQGDTEDFREVLQLLRRREPRTPLHAVGWSLGGNILLKYLGEEGAASPLAAAVAVCAPYRLRPCAERLRSGFSRVYQNHLMRELKDMVKRKQSAVSLPIDLERLLRARDFFEFDEVWAPVNGFAGAEDYYQRASSAPWLSKIVTPTLAIHAEDDPFMVPEIVPAPAELSPAVTLELCATGGHVGFIAAGPRLAPRFWLEQRIPRFLEAPPPA